MKRCAYRLGIQQLAIPPFCLHIFVDMCRSLHPLVVNSASVSLCFLDRLLCPPVLSQCWVRRFLACLAESVVYCLPLFCELRVLVLLKKIMFKVFNKNCRGCANMQTLPANKHATCSRCVIACMCVKFCSCHSLLSWYPAFFPDLVHLIAAARLLNGLCVVRRNVRFVYCVCVSSRLCVVLHRHFFSCCVCVFGCVPRFFVFGVFSLSHLSLLVFLRPLQGTVCGVRVCVFLFVYPPLALDFLWCIIHLQLVRAPVLLVG